MLIFCPFDSKAYPAAKEIVPPRSKQVKYECGNTFVDESDKDAEGELSDEYLKYEEECEMEEMLQDIHGVTTPGIEDDERREEEERMDRILGEFDETRENYERSEDDGWFYQDDF